MKNVVTKSNSFGVLAEVNDCMQDICEEINQNKYLKEARKSMVNAAADNVIEVEYGGLHVRDVAADMSNKMEHSSANSHEEANAQIKVCDVSNSYQQDISNNMLQDFSMDESDGSMSSIKRRRRKFKANKLKGGNNVLSGDPLVETNPKWIKLVSQIQTRSKSKKAKDEAGNSSGIINGGISKKQVFFFLLVLCLGLHSATVLYGAWYGVIWLVFFME